MLEHSISLCLFNHHDRTHFATRPKQVQALQESEVFDVLVIGGGVTGCGVALDSVTRGIIASSHQSSLLSPCSFFPVFRPQDSSGGER